MRKGMIATAAVATALLTAACEEIEPELVDQAEPADVTDEQTSGSDADGGQNGDDGKNDEAEAAQNEDDGPYGIGDTVAMGDVEHTLHGARWSSGDEFFGPEDGERWLVLDIEVTNTGDSSEVVSSMLMWTLVDADNRSAEIALTGDEQGGLDGELGARRSMRGETAFVVPDDGSDTWELVFDPDAFGSGQAIYVLTGDDVADG
jgi:hypothetical protein